jgi:L-ascorbate metabolism protein UlaG (beta-lactamase superfamily)
LSELSARNLFESGCQQADRAVMKTLTDAFNSLTAAAAAVVLAAGQVAAAEAQLTGDRVPTDQGDLVIHPINHATLALGWNGRTIYVDPVGGAKRFQGLPPADLIVITDIHGDHLDVPTLTAVAGPKTDLIVPKVVADKLPPNLQRRATVLANADTKSLLNIGIEAVPMYNTTPDRLQFHSKGRGNGYALTLGGKRVYISGDTEDIPEMRALKNIDVAFVCMNLPYTMTVEQAADAVRAFKPKIVYPYHYHGSDLQKFKQLVGENSGVEVRLRDWYS